MKSMFREFYPLDENDLNKLWHECVFVFDTNVLLRLFRYREATVEYVFKVLDHFSHRLWIPHQVGWEFQHNREKKIAEGKVVYDDIVSELGKMDNKIKDYLDKLKDFGIHPAIDLDNTLVDLRKEISNSKDYIKSQYEKAPLTDHYKKVFMEITDIFDNKVGTPFSQTALNELYKSGSQRYKNKIPPGFADAKNKENLPDQTLYGDLLLWRQILDYAKAKKHSIILITEEKKDDWWDNRGGITRGPLPALREEFQREVGTLFYMYRVENFLELSKKYGAPKPNENTEVDIKEDVRNVGQSDTVISMPRSNIDFTIDNYPEVEAYINSLRNVYKNNKNPNRREIISRTQDDVKYTIDCIRQNDDHISFIMEDDSVAHMRDNLLQPLLDRKDYLHKELKNKIREIDYLIHSWG